MSEISFSHIFLFLSPLLDSVELYNIRDSYNTVVGPVLATLSGSPHMLRRIVLYIGSISMVIVKKSIVNFKNLRSLELLDAVSMSDFSLCEVLGTLPSLENLALETYDHRSASHPPRAPEDSNSQSGGLRYFDALESLHVTGALVFIQRLLGFIDSPYLKSIEVSFIGYEPEPEDFLTSSMTIVASKWSRSLKKLTIDLNQGTFANGMLFTDLHEIQTFRLVDARGMENNNDAVRCLAMSWPKLQTLALYSYRSPNQVFISISTIRIIAENCPDLRCLEIQLDISTIPPFDDTSSKSLCHNLEVLEIRHILDVLGPDIMPQKRLEYQIDVARHLDLIFPYLKTIKVLDDNFPNLVKLCQDVRRRQI